MTLDLQIFDQLPNTESVNSKKDFHLMKTFNINFFYDATNKLDLFSMTTWCIHLWYNESS